MAIQVRIQGKKPKTGVGTKHPRNNKGDLFWHPGDRK